jgi:hypothetical protein
MEIRLDLIVMRKQEFALCQQVIMLHMFCKEVKRVELKDPEDLGNPEDPEDLENIKHYISNINKYI